VDLSTLAALGSAYPYNTYNYSTERVVDGAFVRLRTAALTYTFPERKIARTRLTNASISLTGTNLLLLYADKKLYGQDPEFVASGGVALPVPKQLTLTLKLGI
jgi:hypothetical protein